jgi:hypothetical protein
LLAAELDFESQQENGCKYVTGAGVKTTGVFCLAFIFSLRLGTLMQSKLFVMFNLNN